MSHLTQIRSNRESQKLLTLISKADSKRPTSAHLSDRRNLSTSMTILLKRRLLSRNKMTLGSLSCLSHQLTLMLSPCRNQEKVMQ